MATRLFVGSLAYTMTDDELSTLFTQAGTVVSAKVIIDRDTNRSKGFGFVEMGSEQEAQAAIKLFDGSDQSGRRLTVNEAKPMPERTDRPNNGGGRRF